MLLSPMSRLPNVPPPHLASALLLEVVVFHAGLPTIDAPLVCAPAPSGLSCRNKGTRPEPDRHSSRERAPPVVGPHSGRSTAITLLGLMRFLED